MIDSGEEFAGIEYVHVGKLIGNIITVIRMSVGDNDFGDIQALGASKNIVFWFIWILILYVTCIIFLNFIIAEACASYERVSDNIENFLMYQKATMIHETEDMLWPMFKNNQCFPKYLIVRQVEE